MKKTTSQNLSKRLTQYGALSAAIAGVGTVNGQIYYSGIIDATAFNDVYSIDLDGDGNNDFQMDHYNNGTYYNSLLFNRVFNPQNGVLGNLVNGANLDYVYPFALNGGELISSGKPDWLSRDGNMYLNIRSCYYSNSNWCDGESQLIDKYLGIRFEFDGGIHYGWIRLEVGTNPSNWLLKDYAYNTTPGEAIEAGQQTLGIQDNVFNNVKIVALNKSIALHNLPEKLNYSVFEMSGKVALKGATANDMDVIEASTLSSGVYIIELRSQSNAVIRKKLVLQ